MCDRVCHRICNRYRCVKPWIRSTSRSNLLPTCSVHVYAQEARYAVDCAPAYPSRRFSTGASCLQSPSPHPNKSPERPITTVPRAPPETPPERSITSPKHPTTPPDAPATSVANDISRVMHMSNSVMRQSNKGKSTRYVYWNHLYRPSQSRNKQLHPRFFTNIKSDLEK